MKTILALSAFCFTGTAGLCDAPKAEPKLVEISRTCLRENSDAMNFCSAHRFEDGEVWLGHTIGRHTVSEREAAMISKDNGKTFSETDLPRGGSCVFATRDGLKRRIKCHDSKKIKEDHVIKVITYDKDVKRPVSLCTVKFPSPSGFRHWRDVIRLKNGKLIATGYGCVRQGKGQHMSFFLESDDDGLNWKYLSNLPYEDTVQEGLNETAVIELKNGTLLAYVRTGYSMRGDKSHPLLQFASTDGGRTWGGRREIQPNGVDPQALLLSDGTLVVVSGRPGVYMLFDPTGTGESYRRHDVYNGMGSSYSTLIEAEPGKLFLFYDESSFCGYKNQNPPNRIMKVEYLYR